MEEGIEVFFFTVPYSSRLRLANAVTQPVRLFPNSLCSL